MANLTIAAEDRDGELLELAKCLDSCELRHAPAKAAPTDSWYEFRSEVMDNLVSHLRNSVPADDRETYLRAEVLVDFAFRHGDSLSKIAALAATLAAEASSKPAKAA